MADITLKDGVGNAITYSGVTQIEIGNSKFSNMEELYFYYAKPIGENQFEVVGAWFISRGKNYAACSLTNKQCELGRLDKNLDGDDVYTLFCIFTTKTLTTGNTYSFADL